MTPEERAELAREEARIAERFAALEAERDRLREQLAAFVPPGALGAGETPALCGTCKDRLCVPGLPGCARCVAEQVERLREEERRQRETAEAASRGWRIEVAEVERLRAELAETTHALEVTGEKVTALRKQRDQAETERDRARDTTTTSNTVLGEQIDRAIAAETERDRIRLAWKSARRGRRSARLLNRELIASMDVLHRRLQQYMDDKNTAAAHFTNRYSRMHLERDQMRTERDAAREQVKRVREVAACLRRHEANLKERYDKATNDARATALLSSAALTGDAAHRIERALDGTEPGQ